MCRVAQVPRREDGPHTTTTGKAQWQKEIDLAGSSRRHNISIPSEHYCTFYSCGKIRASTYSWSCEMPLTFNSCLVLQNFPSCLPLSIFPKQAKTQAFTPKTVVYRNDILCRFSLFSNIYQSGHIESISDRDEVRIHDAWIRLHPNLMALISRMASLAAEILQGTRESQSPAPASSPLGIVAASFNLSLADPCFPETLKHCEL